MWGWFVALPMLTAIVAWFAWGWNPPADWFDAGLLLFGSAVGAGIVLAVLAELGADRR